VIGGAPVGTVSVHVTLYELPIIAGATVIVGALGTEFLIAAEALEVVVPTEFVAETV
jgi:hypothetical protein